MGCRGLLAPAGAPRSRPRARTRAASAARADQGALPRTDYRPGPHEPGKRRLVTTFNPISPPSPRQGGNVPATSTPAGTCPKQTHPSGQVPRRGPSNVTSPPPEGAGGGPVPTLEPLAAAVSGHHPPADDRVSIGALATPLVAQNPLEGLQSSGRRERVLVDVVGPGTGTRPAAMVA